jgi:hypothetical protein
VVLLNTKSVEVVMRQILMASAIALALANSAALAEEPVPLTETQMDQVTAGIVPPGGSQVVITKDGNVLVEQPINRPSNIDIEVTITTGEGAIGPIGGL